MDDSLQPKKIAFLVAYTECGNITQAAEAAGIQRQSHYRWLEEGREYQLAFGAAKQQAGERLEQEARRRAVEGVRKYRFHKGKPILDPTAGICPITGEQLSVPYYEDERSDLLLIFLLKAVFPDKYRERQQVSMEVKTDDQSRHDFLVDRLAEIDQLLSGPRTGGGGTGSSEGGNGRLGGNGQSGTIESA